MAGGFPFIPSKPVETSHFTYWQYSKTPP